MIRSLLIDVGAGTLDLLWHNSTTGELYKAVITSPVRRLARTIEVTPGDLLVTGVEMGGGPVTRALRERARDNDVAITAEAAQTIHHDRARIEKLGLEIIDEEEELARLESGWRSQIELCDIDGGQLLPLVDALGVSRDLDVVGCCAQDHGVASPGVSHLEHRHQALHQRLARGEPLHTLLFSAAELPPTFNRLRSMASSASCFQAGEVFVMDSGIAAIIGARTDPRCRDARRVVVLDVATSHTVAAAFDGEELCALVEYHTKDLTTAKLDELFVELVEGKLNHESVIAAGGHGALTRRRLGALEEVELFLATGPKRALLQGSRAPITLGAPLGDNMMTGTAGLLEAIRCREGARRDDPTRFST